MKKRKGFQGGNTHGAVARIDTCCGVVLLTRAAVSFASNRPWCVCVCARARASARAIAFKFEQVQRSASRATKASGVPASAMDDWRAPLRTRS